MGKTFDNTKYECYDRCEVEGVYAHQRNLQPARQNKSPFFGQVIHAGLKAFYDGRDIQAVYDAASAHWAKAKQVWGEDDKPHLDLQRAHEILHLYAQAYPRADWGFDLLHNECWTDAADDEGAILDRGLRLHSDGQVYAMDTKSSGLFIGEAFLRSYAHSQQAAIQIDALEYSLKEPVAGFIFDGIFLSSRKAGPSIEDFSRSMPMPYSTALRAELRAQRAAKRLRIKHLEARPEEAVKNTKSCFRYNSLCGMLKYCTADPADREDMIALDLAVGFLVKRPWVPQERDD